MKNTIVTSGPLARLWWIPLITGLASVALGVWCILSPQSSLPVFSYIFAGCMCVSALLNFLLAGINSGPGSGWGWSLALGILELIAGVWLFTLPEATLVETFIIIIGIWILVAAINSICEATMLSYLSPWMTIWMVLLLIATIFFAIIFLSNPIAGGIAVWLYIGVSLITFGIFRISLAIGVRKAGLSRF